MREEDWDDDDESEDGQGATWLTGELSMPEAAYWTRGLAVDPRAAEQRHLIEAYRDGLLACGEAVARVERWDVRISRTETCRAELARRLDSLTSRKREAYTLAIERVDVELADYQAKRAEALEAYDLAFRALKPLRAAITVPQNAMAPELSDAFVRAGHPYYAGVSTGAPLTPDAQGRVGHKRGGHGNGYAPGERPSREHNRARKYVRRYFGA